MELSYVTPSRVCVYILKCVFVRNSSPDNGSPRQIRLGMQVVRTEMRTWANLFVRKRRPENGSPRRIRPGMQVVRTELRTCFGMSFFRVILPYRGGAPNTLLYILYISIVYIHISRIRCHSAQIWSYRTSVK